VHEDVEPAPKPLDPLEKWVLMLVNRDVERDDDRRANALGEPAHIRFGLDVEIGDREFGPCVSERLRDAPGDRLFVRDANHERMLVIDHRRASLCSAICRRRVTVM
jgi:hypothetical protein